MEQPCEAGEVARGDGTEMSWQVNWKTWHWPWWNVDEIVEVHLGTVDPYYAHNAGIGPFQFRWYSSGDWR